jgi:hypothetical protein
MMMHCGWAATTCSHETEVQECLRFAKMFVPPPPAGRPGRRRHAGGPDHMGPRPLRDIRVPREQSVPGSAARCQPVAECVASGDAAGAVGRDGYGGAGMQDGRKRLDAVDQAGPGADHETVGIDRPDRDAGQLVGD